MDKFKVILINCIVIGALVLACFDANGEQKENNRPRLTGNLMYKICKSPDARVNLGCTIYFTGYLDGVTAGSYGIDLTIPPNQSISILTIEEPALNFIHSNPSLANENLDMLIIGALINNGLAKLKQADNTPPQIKAQYEGMRIAIPFLEEGLKIMPYFQTIQGRLNVWFGNKKYTAEWNRGNRVLSIAASAMTRGCQTDNECTAEFEKWRKRFFPSSIFQPSSFYASKLIEQISMMKDMLRTNNNPTIDYSTLTNTQLKSIAQGKNVGF